MKSEPSIFDATDGGTEDAADAEGVAAGSPEVSAGPAGQMNAA